MRAGISPAPDLRSRQLLLANEHTAKDVELANAAIDASGQTATGDVSLNVTGTTTQTVPVRAGGLALLGTGPYLLTNAGNDLDTLAASTTGDIALADVDDIAIGTVAGTIGVTSGGTLTLTAGSLAGPGPISVDKLILNLGAWGCCRP